MKKLLILMASSFLAGSAFASCCDNKESDNSDLNMKLYGQVDFEAGIRSNKEGHLFNDLTGTSKNAALSTTATVNLKVENGCDSGMKYGAVLAIDTTTKRNGSGSLNGSHIFIQNKFGKLELGTSADAAYTMNVSAYSIARATGDNWYDYAANVKKDFYIGGTVVNTSTLANSLSDSKNERAKKITYYSPEFSGFQFGISYIHDTTKTGYGYSDDPQKLIKKALDSRFFPIKNLVAAGLTYHRNISDGFDIKFSVTGEFGKPRPLALSIPLTPPIVLDVNFKDLKAISAGAMVNYGNFAFAGSYTHFGNSLMPYTSNPASTNRVNTINLLLEKSDWKQYTAGAAYTNGPIGASLTYLHVEKNKNKQDSFTLGLDYKLAPGLLPYAEFTYYNQKSRGADLTTLATRLAANTQILPTQISEDKRKGAVFIFGVKLTF